MRIQFLWNSTDIVCCNVDVLLEYVDLGICDLDFQNIPDVVFPVVYLCVWE